MDQELKKFIAEQARLSVWKAIDEAPDEVYETILPQIAEHIRHHLRPDSSGRMPPARHVIALRKALTCLEAVDA